MFDPKTGRVDFSFIDSFIHWLFRGKRGRILILIIVLVIILAVFTNNFERTANQSQTNTVQTESTP